MSNSVITIEVQGEQLLTGLLENGRLMEYHRFNKNEEALLGSVIMGQVHSRVGGLSACLVNLQQDRLGFMNLKAGDSLRPGDLVPVQVQQEGSGQKGYRVIREYTLASQNLVFTPFDLRTSISSKIEAEGLKSHFRGLRTHFPDEGKGGWIFRTQAASASDEKLLSEANALYAQSLSIQSQARTAAYGSVLYRPPHPLLSYLLDQPQDRIRKIVCDDKPAVLTLKKQLQEIQSPLSEKIEFFDQGRWSIREFYRMTGQLLDAVNRKVLVDEGISIVIDETEALVAIDVNSGSFSAGSVSEQTILKANLKAASEILHQIRLRNLSGIIIIDFIDMHSPASREQLMDAIKDSAKKDRQKVTVHDFTKLGLMELTRRRESLPLSSFLTKELI